MYKHILITTDGSELARKGVDHGLSLAMSLGATVLIVTVTEPLPLFYNAAAFGSETSESEHYQAGQKVFADTVLTEAKDAADKIGVKAETVHVSNSRPAEAILAIAAARGCSLIVMASHGRRGLSRLLLGSQTSEVVSYSPIPVLVVR